MWELTNKFGEKKYISEKVWKKSNRFACKGCFVTAHPSVKHGTVRSKDFGDALRAYVDYRGEVFAYELVMETVMMGEEENIYLGDLVVDFFDDGNSVFRTWRELVEAVTNKS